MNKNILLNKLNINVNELKFSLKFKNKLTLINSECDFEKKMLFKAIERDTLIKHTQTLYV